MEIFGIPIQAFLGQLLLGLVNGSFYAMLSLGLAVIFGLLGIVNFAHGALYMIGAYVAWIGMEKFGINYWMSLLLAPLIVGALGVAVERSLLKHLYKIDPIYGLLLTFGLALIAEGVFRDQFGVSGQSYSVPEALSGATNLGFMVLPNYRAWVVFASLAVCLGTWFVIERTLLKHLYKIDPIYGLLLTFGLALIAEGIFRYYFGVSGESYPVPDLLAGATNLGFMVLPNYRAWVVVASLVVCLGTWFLIEKTRLGAYLRAGTENPALVQAFGINVPIMVMFTYAAGAGLAALAGVLAAPVIQVTPLMGSNLIIVVFAVVVIGGMGSILGSIVTGLGLGIVEGFTKVFWPEASSTVVFIIMVIVLLLRPAGLFGKES